MGKRGLALVMRAVVEHVQQKICSAIGPELFRVFGHKYKTNPNTTKVWSEDLKSLRISSSRLGNASSLQLSTAVRYAV